MKNGSKCQNNTKSGDFGFFSTAEILSSFQFFHFFNAVSTPKTLFPDKNNVCRQKPQFLWKKSVFLFFYPTEHFFRFCSESLDFELPQKTNPESQKFRNGLLKYCFSKALTVLSTKHVVSEKNIFEGSHDFKKTPKTSSRKTTC